jgi:hypothetical protein
MKTVDTRVTRAVTDDKLPASPSYVALCDLHEVQIVLDDRPLFEALHALPSVLEAFGERSTVVVLDLPPHLPDDDICLILGATESFANIYVLNDHADVARESPYLICDNLPPDRICVFASSTREALKRAWQRVQAGDRLVLTGKSANEALELLPISPEPVGGEVAELRTLLEREVNG